MYFIKQNALDVRQANMEKNMENRQKANETEQAEKNRQMLLQMSMSKGAADSRHSAMEMRMEAVITSNKSLEQRNTNLELDIGSIASNMAMLIDHMLCRFKQDDRNFHLDTACKVLNNVFAYSFSLGNYHSIVSPPAPHKPQVISSSKKTIPSPTVTPTSPNAVVNMCYDTGTFPSTLCDQPSFFSSISAYESPSPSSVFPLEVSKRPFWGQMKWSTQISWPGKRLPWLRTPARSLMILDTIPGWGKARCLAYCEESIPARRPNAPFYCNWGRRRHLQLMPIWLVSMVLLPRTRSCFPNA